MAGNMTQEENKAYWDKLEQCEAKVLGWCSDDDDVFEAFVVLQKHARELEKRLGLEEKQ